MLPNLANSSLYTYIMNGNNSEREAGNPEKMGYDTCSQFKTNESWGWICAQYQKSRLGMNHGSAVWCVWNTNNESSWKNHFMGLLRLNTYI